MTVPGELHQERLALVAVFFTLGAVFASWAGRIPQLQEHLNLTDGQLGISMFCLAIGSLISMPASAALGARFGTARMTVVFSIAFSLSLLLIPIPETWLLFSAALFVSGFAMGGHDVSMNAHAVHVERAYKRPVMSSFHGSFSLGAMCGGALSALMCAMQTTPLTHFIIVATILTPAMIIAGTKLHSPPTVPGQASKIFALPDKHIIILAIVAFCSFIGEGAISDWSAVYLAHELHSGPTLAAAGFTIFCLAMTICRFTGDKVVHRLGPSRVLFWGGIIAGGGIAASLILATPIAVLISYIFVGIGFSCMVPVAFSAAGDNHHLPASVAIAGVATSGYFGFIIAPPIIGFLADRFTLGTALWLPVVLCLVVTMLSPLAVRQNGSTQERAINNTTAEE